MKKLLLTSLVCTALAASADLPVRNSTWTYTSETHAAVAPATAEMAYEGSFFGSAMHTVVAWLSKKGTFFSLR